jgi:hypothetical protein
MRYLLGDLSEDEKTRMEEAFFADDSKFEAVELAEDDLIDAYIRKELSPEELRRFKAKVLRSPRLLERVNFATALSEKADSFRAQEAEAPLEQAPAPAVETTPRWWKGFFAQQPAFGMAMTACVLFVLVAGALLISGWLRLRSEFEQLANERASLQRQKEELDKQLAAQRAKIDEQDAQAQRERDQRAQDAESIEQGGTDKLRESTNRQPSAITVATVLLTSGSLRSGDAGKPKVVIGPQAISAQLRIRLDKNEYPIYNAIVKTLDEVEVFRQPRLKPQNTRSGPQLLLSVPAQKLRPNDYTVEVEGVTPSGVTELVADYSFRVLKQK